MNSDSIIFSNSTEFGIWHSDNCEQCELFTGKYEINQTGCPTLEKVLSEHELGAIKINELRILIGMNNSFEIGRCKNKRTLRKHWKDNVTKNLFN